MRIAVVETWTVREYDVVSSTNLAASNLPAWHAVRADTQTAGRGRFQRSWVSDAGGLWLSAVVPIPQRALAARLIPLLAGLAVCEGLKCLGVPTLRLRWPNDVLVDHKKLAGLLIDQFMPSLAVVGMGINISNRPEASDPILEGQVVRLAELVAPVPPLSTAMGVMLRSLKTIWTETEQLGTESLLERVNGLWQVPRTVLLDLDGRILTGEFGGVDMAGRLILHEPTGRKCLFEPHEVRLLRDIT